MGLSLDPIIEVYGIRPPEGGLFSRCAGLTSTTASKMTSATSAAVAVRRRGAWAFTYSRTASQSAVHGVSTSPGATALTRMSGPSELASSLVMWLTAALEHA